MDEWAAEDSGADGLEIQWTTTIAENVRIFRVGALEGFLSAGVNIAKLDKLRSSLERWRGLCLTRSGHMMETYLGPLKKKYQTKLRKEMEGELVGISHDGTTHEREAFTTTSKWLTEDVIFKSQAMHIHFYEASLNNGAISGLTLNIDH